MECGPRDRQATAVGGVGDQEPSDRSEVGLSVAGLALLPNAAEDLRIFIDTVQTAATLVRERPPSEDGDRLLSTDLARLVTLPVAGRESIVRRQLSIWRTTTGWSSLGGPDPETGVWSLTIDRKAIRRYRDVTRVEDFLRAEPAIPTLSAGLSALGARARPTPHVVMTCHDLLHARTKEERSIRLAQELALALGVRLATFGRNRVAGLVRGVGDRRSRVRPLTASPLR